MTKEEAKERFGIREYDIIVIAGVKNLLINTQEYLKNPFISIQDRERAEKDIEALNALLK